MRSVRFAAALFALSLFAVGCGGDDEEQTTDESTTTVRPDQVFDPRASLLDYFRQDSFRICVDSESGEFDNERLKEAVVEALDFGDANLWQGSWLETEPLEVVAGCPAGPPAGGLPRVEGPTGDKFSIFVFLVDVGAAGPNIGTVSAGQYEVMPPGSNGDDPDKIIAYAIYLSSPEQLSDPRTLAEQIDGLYGSPGGAQIPEFLGQDSFAICVESPSGEFDDDVIRGALEDALRFGFENLWQGSYLQTPFELRIGCPLDPVPLGSINHVAGLTSHFSIYVYALTAAEAVGLGVESTTSYIPAGPMETVLLDDSHDPETHTAYAIYLVEETLGLTEKIAGTIGALYGRPADSEGQGDGCEGPSSEVAPEHCAINATGERTHYLQLLGVTVSVTLLENPDCRSQLEAYNSGFQGQDLTPECQGVFARFAEQLHTYQPPDHCRILHEILIERSEVIASGHQLAIVGLFTPEATEAFAAAAAGCGLQED